jgi:hypothetical protein
LGAAFFKHKYLINPAVTHKDRVIEAAEALAPALNNQMPPHMHESTIQALRDRDLQDVFQQTTINYNTDSATHVTPAASPRVPPDIIPKPATPVTSPTVHDIRNTPVVPT